MGEYTELFGCYREPRLAPTVILEFGLEFCVLVPNICCILIQEHTPGLTDCYYLTEHPLNGQTMAL